MRTSSRIAFLFCIFSIIASAVVYWHILYVSSIFQVVTIFPNAIAALIINTVLGLGYQANQIPFLVCYIAVNSIYGALTGYFLNKISRLSGNTQTIFVISLIPYLVVAVLLYGVLFLHGGS